MKRKATFYALLAVALYAVNMPLSKILLRSVQPTMMAAFLYRGARRPVPVITSHASHEHIQIHREDGSAHHHLDGHGHVHAA